MTSRSARQSTRDVHTPIRYMLAMVVVLGLLGLGCTLLDLLAPSVAPTPPPPSRPPSALLPPTPAPPRTAPLPTSIPTLTLVHKLTGHKGSVSSLAFSPDNTLLASGSNDKTVRLWRVSDGTLANRLVGLSDPPQRNGMVFSADGKLLAVGIFFRVHLWRVSDGKLLRTITGNNPTQPPATPAPALPPGQPTPAPRLGQPPAAPPLGSVLDLAISPDGSMLAASDNNAIWLWRISDGRLLRNLRGITGFTQSLAFSPDGTLLASGSGDQLVRLWRVSDGILMQTLTGHLDAVEKVFFLPDRTTLASWSRDSTVRLWRVSDGTEMRTLAGFGSKLAGFGGRTLGIAFLSEGKLVATVYPGQQPFSVIVQQWRVSDEQEVSAFMAQAEQFNESTPMPPSMPPFSEVLAFSSDGALMAMALEDTVYVWRMR